MTAWWIAAGSHRQLQAPWDARFPCWEPKSGELPPQELLLEHGVALVLNVKRALLERVAMCTEAMVRWARLPRRRLDTALCVLI